MVITINTKYDIGQTVNVKFGDYEGKNFVIDGMEIHKNLHIDDNRGSEFIRYSGLVGPCTAWWYFEKQLELSPVDMNGYKYEVNEGDIIIWKGNQFTIINKTVEKYQGQQQMGGPVETYGYRITLTLEDDKGEVKEVVWDDRNNPVKVVGKKKKVYV